MDDLLDLSWSAPAPVSSLSQPSRSKAGTPASTFDLLNARAPSRASKPSTPAPPTASTASSDAFGDLLSSFSGSGISNGSSAKQTLVERQAQLAREKQEREDKERKAFEGHGAFWDQLGGQEPVRSAAKAPIIAPKPAHNGSLMDFDDFLAPPPKPSPAPRVSALKTSSDAVDPFDFDALTSTSRSSSTRPGMATPSSNFDFGDFDDNDGVSSGAGPSRVPSALAREQTDDDFLGDLGKPVEHVRKQTSPPAVRTRRPASPSKATRSSSPPPHVLGRIVEMGFSPAQARKALAQTSTGLDVEAALELLLGASGPSSSRARSPVEDNEDFEMAERELQRRREEQEQERRRRRRAGPSREQGRGDTARDQPSDGTATPLQEQADKILAQASEIGASVFTKASSFWSQGKEKVQRAYEEQRRALEATEGSEDARRDRGKTRTQNGPPDGRPRWMIQAEEDARDDSPARPAANGSSFKDSDDDEPDRPESASARPPPRGPPAPMRRTAQAQDSRSEMSVKERTASLFADEPVAYVSSARRRAPNGRGPPPSSLQSAPAPVRAKTPPPLRPRQLVPAASPQIQQSAAHKAKGNEHFKLGRFAEAESAYTSAISLLPDGHILHVPLHNNRAAARLKQGNSSSAAQDCTTVITIIGIDYHPHRDAPLPAEYEKDVKLADALVKACMKRAQAWEMAEKWAQAKEDWERLMGMDAALLGSSMGATIKLAGEGARRAKKMLDGPQEVKSARPPAVKPKPRPAPKSSAPFKSEGVDKMRQAAAQLEVENDQRTAVKDSVDAKINAWKAGKETNLRALIASLDTVLWPEVVKNGLKVGMHELITEKQVKIKYMRVIGRLHPDKLNVATDTTVEQKMLANGVFSTLSEAWQAFNA